MSSWVGSRGLRGLENRGLVLFQTHCDNFPELNRVSSLYIHKLPLFCDHVSYYCSNSVSSVLTRRMAPDCNSTVYTYIVRDTQSLEMDTLFVSEWLSASLGFECVAVV